MFWYFVKKLALVFPTFIGISFVSFALIHLIPGDPVEIMAGERGLDPAHHAEILKNLGLDQPLYVQYGRYLYSILRLDFGNSLVTHEPVSNEFAKLFPATLELAVAAMIFALVLGLAAGVIAAVNRGTIFDHGVMGLSLTGFSMPIFWWGLMLIMYFSVHMGWTPVSGRIDLNFDIVRRTGFMLVDSWLAEAADAKGNAGAFKDALKHLILPALVLGTIPMAVIARMTRSSMLEVLREDYVRTARAKGLSPWRVIVIHALRNALIPVITVVGLQVGALMGGAVMTETIFSWPGIGKWIIEAVGRRDYPVVQDGILIVATLVIFTNLLVDTLYGVINPRVRHVR